MNNHTITALLPMREGSKRVTGKNKRELAGQPLFQHILRKLQTVEAVSQIVVSTDDKEILSLLGEEQKVVCINRDASLADDTASMNDVIADCLSRVAGEDFIQVHATSPLIEPKSIQDAIHDYFQIASPKGKSLMAVQELEGRLWSTTMKPLNHDPDVLLPTQNMEKVLLDCSAFYIFSRHGFAKKRSRIYGPPIVKVLSEREGLDIDYEWQFDLAEMYLARKTS